MTLMNILFGIVGMTIVFLVRLDAAMKRKEVKFSGRKWFSENWLETVLGAIGTFCGIFLMDDLGSFFGITLEAGRGEASYSLFFGLNGQFIISKLKSIIK